MAVRARSSTSGLSTQHVDGELSGITAWWGERCICLSRVHCEVTAGLRQRQVGPLGRLGDSGNFRAARARSVRWTIASPRLALHQATSLAVPLTFGANVASGSSTVPREVTTGLRQRRGSPGGRLSQGGNCRAARSRSVRWTIASPHLEALAAQAIMSMQLLIDPGWGEC